MSRKAKQGSQKLKLIDLFAGAGGMSLGFVDPRFHGLFECVFGIDNDPAAVKTHNLNLGGHAVCASIEEWISNGEAIPEADIVVGGPPCQGFSLLNKKRVGDVRRELWEPYMEIVEASSARMFIIENVAGLSKSPELAQIRRRARKLGFETKVEVLNTADYGVPQTRRRTIVFGWKLSEFGDAIEFPPAPTHAAPGKSSNLPAWLTVRDAISDLPAPKGTEIRGEAGPLDIHFGRTPTETSLQRYKHVPPGGNRFDLQANAPHLTPQCWIKKKSGGTDLFGRLWWDRPSVTIRTEFFKPEKGRYLHPVKHRPITHREAARLMGFPDDFKFVGSKIEVARQIGNAVPPPFAAALAQYVSDLLTARRNLKVA